MQFEGFGIGSASVYWTLRILVLAVLIFSGYGISYGKKEQFKGYAWLAAVVYSLVIGLRWMRGADYCHYYNDLVTCFGQYPGAYGAGIITPDPEPIYEFWVTSFFFSGLPFWVAFIFYAALLIFSVLMVVKQLPKTAVWALPAFFLLTVLSSENIIRQYFASAFIILAYYFYLKDEKKKMLLMLVIPPLIHYSSLTIVLPFVLLAYFINDKTINFLTSKALMWLLLVAYIYFYWLFDISNFSVISDLITNNVSVDGDDKMSLYTENADRWFTDEGSISQVVSGKAAGAIGIVAQFARFLSYLAIVYFGFKIQKENRKLILAYILSYGAIFFKVATGDIEIYARFYNWYVLLMPFLIGAFMTSNKIKHDMKIIVATIFILNFLWYGFLATISSSSMFGYGFVWDATVNLSFR